MNLFKKRSFEKYFAQHPFCLIDNHEASLLRRYINKEKQFRIQIMSHLPDFKGKETITKIFYNLYHLFTRRKKRWIKGTQWR